jgi:hypothetical protein
VPSSVLAKCGSGWLTTWLAGAVWIEPVTSLCEEGGVLEPKPSPKRPESALQPAAPSPINEMATSCGQMADRGDADIGYSLARNKEDERIDTVAVNRRLSAARLFYMVCYVFPRLQFARLTRQKRHKSHCDQIFPR